MTTTSSSSSIEIYLNSKCIKLLRLPQRFKDDYCGVFTSVFMNKAESCNQLLSRPPTNEGRDGVFMTSPLEGGTMSCMQPWLAWKDFARSSGGGSVAF